jgi:hypothetical protein
MQDGDDVGLVLSGKRRTGDLDIGLIALRMSLDFTTPPFLLRGYSFCGSVSRKNSITCCLLLNIVEKNGGPGRTRTCNQTVMSGRL